MPFNLSAVCSEHGEGYVNVCGLTVPAQDHPGRIGTGRDTGHPEPHNRSMANRSNSATLEITPDVLLKAYACGIFPMAESADDPALYWVEPERRGIIPLDGFHVPSRLARTVRNTAFRVVIDHDFPAVIDGCAAAADGRERTWINERIRSLYVALAERGCCHSVEVYDGDALVGGLYGLALGRAFFGESMFHRATDASKIALVHLVARLIAGGFTLLDTQFITSHLQSFGAIEVPRRRYQTLLADALVGEAAFDRLPPEIGGTQALVLIKGSATY